MGVANAYLTAYNAVQAAGWAYILTLVVGNIGACEEGNEHDLVPEFMPVGRGLVCTTGDNAAAYALLQWFQTAAVLEIVHAKIGIVRSGVMTTFQQVFSRVMLVWGVVFVMPSLTATAGFTNMCLAWCITEVVRYSWYALKIMLGDAPYALTWCRYTFFYVLYPLGVWSELRCNLAAANYTDALGAAGELAEGEADDELLVKLGAAYQYTMYFFCLMYIPLFPGLYMHMIAQRKKVLNPRRPRPVVTEGIQFPKDKTGKRSTTATGQAAFAASILSVDYPAAIECLKERSWRWGYEKHVVKNVAISCRDEKTCLEVATAGLDYMHNTFEFVRDGNAMSVREAMATIKDTFPGTMTIEGTGSRPEGGYAVPYRRTPYPAVTEPENLRGDDLLKQLDAWADAGTIEPSARDAIADVVKNSKWQDLSDKYFVLLGAGSAMGPLQVLLSLGAHVIAIDLDRAPIWERLVGMARNSCGKMTFPLKVKESDVTSDAEMFANAGSNLFTQTPEICNWLKTIHKGKDLVIGSYAYLDGEAHVRVSLAMDAIMSEVAAARPKGSVTLAYLCSPTDVFVVDEEANQAVKANLRSGGAINAFAKVMHLLNKKFCKPNLVTPAESSDGKTTYYINNGIVAEQGPNYALAKRLQHWRAMLARSQGTPASTNIAPSTATISVVHNRSFAMAYSGFRFFKPMEVAFQETSNAVMGALLIHDVCSPKSKVGEEKHLLPWVFRRLARHHSLPAPDTHARTHACRRRLFVSHSAPRTS